MTRESITAQIKNNFIQIGWQIDELRIQPDPFSGWCLVIISPDFEEKSQSERKDAVLAGLEDCHFEWLELLTPEEKEWSGNLPLDMNEPETLPFWPEAMARGANLEQTKAPVHFLSDTDEDIELPVIATFYSLRGGVGRSTAMAYTAHLLAKGGQKVVCIDMDLEAPGIASLFGKEKEVGEDMGLVHLLVAIDQGGKPDISKHLIRITESYDLYCLPAGKPDANYARLLRFIDPESWYREERNPLRELMDRLRTDLPFTPDVILLDARTGITQLSGPLMFDLSDISVIVFFPHPQAKAGTEGLVKALLAAKTKRKINGTAFTPEIRFLVSPIPSGNINEVRRYQNRASEWIAEWISPVMDGTLSGQDIIESDITHFVPYKEVIATSDQILKEDDIWRNFSPVADWIEGFLTLKNDTLSNTGLAERKSDILKSFRFSIGTAENQENLLDTFLETDVVKKALSPQIPLVLGRKGTGKTALFRRISEVNNNETFIITSPGKLSNRHPFYMNTDGFKELEEILTKENADWSEFWTIYIGVVCYYSLLEQNNDVPKPKEDIIINLLEKKPCTSLEIVNFIEQFIKIPRYRLIANDWLFKLDDTINTGRALLFDGLDTGFGQTERDRDRRSAALEGLFTLLTDSGDRFKHLKFKIMLREDIWKALKFENKSHLFGRSAQLKWDDQVSFLKVALKQAVRSDFFLKLIGDTYSSKIEDWSEKEVITAWNLLVGERMRGGKTAFTRNWVWKRLADGNSDHSPRYLLQLMHLAVDWEKKEQEKAPYEKSLIRPRAFSKIFPEVSEQALQALRNEEFPELEPLMKKMEGQRTPIDAEKLDNTDTSHLVGLAKEVGLLAVYEERGEKIIRFMVPELLRHALKMTRKGQM
ncbi:MAG: CpsD/CapB family tyrosine-protein kinase [bacterium]|nr:CpsD/CapB family tyrosine-protein kinase [bacterium]